MIVRGTSQAKSKFSCIAWQSVMTQSSVIASISKVRHRGTQQVVHIMQREWLFSPFWIPNKIMFILLTYCMMAGVVRLRWSSGSNSPENLLQRSTTKFSSIFLVLLEAREDQADLKGCKIRCNTNKQLQVISNHLQILSSRSQMNRQSSAMSNRTCLAQSNFFPSTRLVTLINITGVLALILLINYTFYTGSNYVYFLPLFSAFLDLFLDFILSKLFDAAGIIIRTYIDLEERLQQLILSMAFIYEQSSSEVESVTKSDTPSQRASHGSRNSYSNSLAQKAKSQLLNYEDINDQDFELLPSSTEPQNLLHQYFSIGEPESTCYMHRHKMEVPIGHRHQAQLVQLIPIDKYKQVNRARIASLEDLKVHDPLVNTLFYQQNNELVEQIFGSKRSYEELCLLKLAYDKKSAYDSLQQYLSDQNIFDFWSEQFENNDKLMNKTTRRRKKKNK